MTDNVNPSLLRCDYSPPSPAPRGGWGGGGNVGTGARGDVGTRGRGDRGKGGRGERGCPKILGGLYSHRNFKKISPYPSLPKHTTGFKLGTVMVP